MSLADAVDELIEDTGTRPTLTVPAPDQLSSRQMGEVLRAAHLAREWLQTPEGRELPVFVAHRAFVLGYLAACKDRE